MEKLSIFSDLCLDRAALGKRERRFSDTASTATHDSAGKLIRDQLDGQQRTHYEATQPPSSTASAAAGHLTCAQHECNAPRCAIAEVFETTELLELVLNFLNTVDVLRLGTGCCRKWRDLTLTRPQLRRHLFLLPQWSRPPREFELLGANVEGLSMERGDEVQNGQWIIVCMTRNAACQVLPAGKMRARVRSRSIFEGLRGGLGPRSSGSGACWPLGEPHTLLESVLRHEDLQVSQPPVLGMQAFLANTEYDVTRDCDDDAEPCASLKLHCDGGITLGFLAETALSLLSEGDTAASKNGTVVFKAIISFTAPCPRRHGLTRTVTRLT